MHAITKMTILGLLVIGVALSALSLMSFGASSVLLRAGLTLLLAAALVLLASLYHRKVNVYARGGVLKFGESPWGYRVYFATLWTPALIALVVIWARPCARC